MATGSDVGRPPVGALLLKEVDFPASKHASLHFAHTAAVFALVQLVRRSGRRRHRAPQAPARSSMSPPPARPLRLAAAALALASLALASDMASEAGSKASSSADADTCIDRKAVSGAPPCIDAYDAEFHVAGYCAERAALCSDDEYAYRAVHQAHCRKTCGLCGGAEENNGAAEFATGDAGKLLAAHSTRDRRFHSIRQRRGGCRQIDGATGSGAVRGGVRRAVPGGAPAGRSGAGRRRDRGGRQHV